MNIRKYSVLVALMMIVTCGQSAASRFAEKEKTDGDSLPSDILSYGKGARGKEFYGLRMGGNGGTLVPVFSKDSSYVAIITCDTTKKGKTGDVGLLSVYSAKDSKKAAWVKKINPKTTSFSINGPYMVSVMQLEVGKEKAIRNYVEFRKLETGKVESFIQTTPIYVNDSLDIVLGVGNDAFPDLFAYRISDGSFLWKSDKWGSQAQRCYTQLYDEKTLFAVADNLYKINLETGKVYKKKVRAYDEGLDASAFFAGGLIGTLLSTALFGVLLWLYKKYKKNERKKKQDLEIHQKEIDKWNDNFLQVCQKLEVSKNELETLQKDKKLLADQMQQQIEALQDEITEYKKMRVRMEPSENIATLDEENVYKRYYRFLRGFI